MRQTFRSLSSLAMKLLRCVHIGKIPLIRHVQYESLTLLQIIPESYQNVAQHIKIPGLPEEIIPDSPEDLKIPVPPSGLVSPIQGLGSPEGQNTPQSGYRTPSGIRTPREPERISQQHVEDVV